VHYAQFAAVMLLLGGFVILHKVIAGGSPRIVDQLVFVATIMSAAALTVLQAVDGVALKHAVDAWAAATGPEQTERFGDAETMRWLEWGVNSFFYSLVGLMVGRPVWSSSPGPSCRGGSAGLPCCPVSV
jgi:predicted small integral membrane protein